LYISIEINNVDIVNLLLDKGIENFLCVLQPKKLPLMAQFESIFYQVHYTWRRPVDIIEHTALTWAARCGKDAIVQALLERGGVSRSERLRAAKEALAGGHPLLAATLAGGAWKPEKPAR
jgi:ankyrin repeat protein